MTLLPRLLAALVGLPILLGAVWLGTPWLVILVAVVAIAATREFYRLFDSGDAALPLVLGCPWALAFLLGQQLSQGTAGFLGTSSVVVAGGAFAALLWLIAAYRGRRPLPAAGFLIMGPVVVGFILVHALALRELGTDDDLGRNWLLLALLTTFACDTGAFFAGRTLGRHRMAPVISPNKTWEGAVGGFAAAVLAALALGFALDLCVSRWQQGLVGGTVGVAAQLGDLGESRLKRFSQVKDAGSIIPGHGGVLDRLDSLSLSIPTVYYLGLLMSGCGISE